MIIIHNYVVVEFNYGICASQQLIDSSSCQATSRFGARLAAVLMLMKDWSSGLPTMF